MKLSRILDSYKLKRNEKRKHQISNYKRNKTHNKIETEQKRKNEAERKRKYRECKAQKRKQNTLRKKKSRQNHQNGPHEGSEEKKSNVDGFVHRSTLIRAIARVRTALPKSPSKRAAAINKYLNSKSPTINLLRKSQSEENIFENVVKDIKTVVKSIKSKRCKDALTTMNVLVASVSGENVAKSKCIKRLSNELELPIRRISGGKRIRTQVLKSEKSCWAVTVRKTRKDAIDERLKRDIYQFWASPGISRPTGYKQDVKRERLGPRVYASHMLHVLELTQTEAFNEFQRLRPDVKISQRLFERYRPFFVRPVREKDRETCLCRYHVEANIVFRACKSVRRNLIDKMEGVDDISSFDSLGDVIKETMCQQQTSACINRKCKNCGVQNLELLKEEMDTSQSAEKVTWQKYEYNTVSTNGKDLRKLRLVTVNSTVGELFTYFMHLLEKFPAHQHRASWQHGQFKSLLQYLPLTDCVVVHDYSENYRCSDRQEIQSAYFKRTEVTIHVSIIHRHAILEYDGIESTHDNNEIITEILYVISPDQIHDNIFVKEVQKYISSYLKSISYPSADSGVKTMHEFTDGAASQYKSRYSMCDLSSAADELGYERMVRNFFETSHAKGMYTET